MENNIDAIYEHPSDTEAKWENSKRILHKGEMAFSSDKNNMYKVGDGIHLWKDLPYASPGPKGEKGDPGVKGTDGVSITSVVQTTTSNLDGGTNVLTVKLNNGQSTTFTVKNGSTGTAGKAGKDGTNGITPTIGTNGNWFLGTMDTGKPARGANGISPTIGTNGNWFIGTSDTGVPSVDREGLKNKQDLLPKTDDGKYTINVDKLDGKHSSDFAQASHTHSKEDISDFPSSMPASDVSAWAKQAKKPSYSWSEITSKPSTFTPASHAHSKEDISDFPSSMPASDVSAWAKQPNKPSYSWTEITSKPTSMPASDVSAWAKQPNKPSYSWTEIAGKPSTFTPASHAHSKEDISDFPSSMPASDVPTWAKQTKKPSYSWTEITGKPSTFTPASHTHSYLPLSGGEVTGELKSKKFTLNSESAGLYAVNDSVSTHTAVGLMSGWAGPYVSGKTGYYATGLSLGSCSGYLLPHCKKDASNRTNGMPGYSSGSITLGTASYKFGKIYSTSSALNSDVNHKKDILSMSDFTDIDYIDLFDKLDFCKFKWIKETQASLQETPAIRNHLGVMAQPLEKLIFENGYNGVDVDYIDSEFCYSYYDYMNSLMGGWSSYKINEDGTIYSYSENVYKWKHNEDYEVKNEVIEWKFDNIKFEDYRKEVNHLMVVDNSKLTNEQPPLYINSICFIDKNDEIISVDLKNVSVIQFYDENDVDLTNPISSSTLNENGQLEIHFGTMYGSVFIKMFDKPINVDNYKSMLLDIDFIGEYRCFLLPDGNHVTANIKDRVNTDQILYNYSVNYNSIFVTGMHVLQETRKEYANYKKKTEQKLVDLESEVQKLKDLITNLTQGGN